MEFLYKVTLVLTLCAAQVLCVLDGVHSLDLHSKSGGDNGQVELEATGIAADDREKWNLISQNSQVTVDPPWATCGSKTGYELKFNRSDPFQDGLFKTLSEGNNANGSPEGLSQRSLACTNVPCPLYHNYQGRPPRAEVGVNIGDIGQEMVYIQGPVSIPFQGNENRDPRTLPHVILLDELSCPEKFKVSMWVRVNDYRRDKTPYRTLLETKKIIILVPVNISAKQQWQYLEVEVDASTGEYTVRINGKTMTPNVTKPVSSGARRIPCAIYLGGATKARSIKAGFSNITILPLKKNNDSLADKSKRRILPFPQCLCPQSHPVHGMKDRYNCYSSPIDGILRPSQGLDMNQVLVDPQVLVDNQVKPFYWVSTPGASTFNITINLGKKTKVTRVLVLLLTPPPRKGLKIYTHESRSTDSVFYFSDSCKDGGLGPCIVPPRSPKVEGRTHTSYGWYLDTSHSIKQPLRTTETSQIQLEFNGFPIETLFVTSPALAYHVVAKVEVFTTPTDKMYAKKLETGVNTLSEEDNGLDLITETFLGSLSNRREEKIKRVRRQSGRPRVSSISPTYAPTKASVIEIRGENFGQPNVTVMIGNITCICHDSFLNQEPFANLATPGCNTEDHIACLVENIPEILIGQQLAITVRTHDGTEAIIENDIHFTPKPNPVITSFHPREQYIAGGRRVFINGENLDSGVPQEVYLTTWRSGNKNQFGKGNGLKGVCTVHNSTTLNCTTPPANVPKSYQRRKRSAENINKNFYINDEDLTVRMVIRIGDLFFDLYDNLGDNGIMYVAKNPGFDPFPDQVFYLRYYKNENPKLEIVGQRLTHAAEMEDYSVTVGGEQCTITDLASNLIKCLPPAEKDIPDDSRDNNGDPRVSVTVGMVPPYTPGVVRFQYSEPINPTPILAGVLSVVAAILIFLIVLWCWRRKVKYDRLKLRLDRLSENYTNLVSERESMIDLLHDDLKKKVDSCKLEPTSVSRQGEIGKGNFGKVYMGRMSKKSTDETHTDEYAVAIKTIKDEGDTTLRQLEDFLEEATLMLDFDHPNVLRLIGVVIEKNRPYVVLPYMANGDLKKYVSASDRNFKVFDLLKLLTQIADGMSYVSKKGAVHRDLRAVNCMVDSKVVVKVGDFGLARWMEEEYYIVNDKERPLPVKWMAPEALQGHKFSTSSDVWSYGIVMWEVMTRGRKPFADIDNYKMKYYVLNGGRMDKPDYCPDEVYHIMKKCWERQARSRPTFAELASMLRNFMHGAENNESRQVEQDEDYDDVINPRKRSVKNEYMKRPGPIPSYIAILPPTEVEVKKTMSEHENPTFEGKVENDAKYVNEVKKDPGPHYENEDYLQPCVPGKQNGDNSADISSSNTDIPRIPTTKPDSEGGAKPGGVPYFVNPPIANEYVSESGQEKLAMSENTPRGEIYIEKNKVGKANEDEDDHEDRIKSKDPDGDYINEAKSSTERDTEYINQRNSTCESDATMQNHENIPADEQNEMADSTDKNPDYVNDEGNSGDNHDYLKMIGEKENATPNHVVEINHSDSKKSPGVAALAAKFGAGATQDYANQPSHNKRSPTQ